MISYAIDFVLVAALVVVGWRTGVMYRELRVLRHESSAFNKFLAESDSSINKAAHAVVMLRSEGLDTLRALEQRTNEARELAEWLHEAIETAEKRSPVVAARRRERRESTVAEMPMRPERAFAQRIESRLAPATTANR